jgi:hypothetical protein
MQARRGKAAESDALRRVTTNSCRPDAGVQPHVRIARVQPWAEPVRWRLLTTNEVTTLEQAQQIVVYHRAGVLFGESGLRIEAP